MHYLFKVANRQAVGPIASGASIAKRAGLFTKPKCH